MSAARQITIHIKRPLISCTPKGGHAHCQRTDQLQWVSQDAPFTLLFTDFDTGLTRWPFKEAEPQWPVRDTRLLTIENGSGSPLYIKYIVNADRCTALDPIIIVDK